ncbi:MAG: hypothetical protein PHP42_04865 [Bacteroidota bacterium]|nr:hypothetical protein [Bacteroidota bacterium]
MTERIVHRMNYKIHKQYRLPYYNYASTGLYFVTICAHNRECIFGNIEKGKMNLSLVGEIAEQCWNNIPSSSPYAAIDSFTVMPNHVHGIIAIENDEENREILDMKFQPAKKSLSIVVRNFKAAVSIRAREQFPGIKIRQSRFYDRIIRDERELNAIRKYIENNIIRWEEDKNSPNNLMM